MVTDALMYFTGVLVAVAFIALVGVIVLWRRMSGLARSTATTVAALEVYEEALPQRLSEARANLAERGAPLEHTLWQLSRADEQLTIATRRLADGRTRLDATRVRIVNVRSGVERLKQALRVIMRAMELRRAFLG